MRKKFIQKEEVIAKLRKLQGERSDREFAGTLGISASLLSDIYKGKRTPGLKLLEELGLRRVLVYEQAA